VSLARANVPLAVASGVVCLALGIGAGVVGMTVFGYHWEPQEKEAGQGGGPPGGMMAVMPKGKGKGKGKGGQGPSPKVQLVSLVNRLDLLTAKPLVVRLDADQREKVREQLKGLDTMDRLSDEEAGKRLGALLDVLKDQRQALEAVGFQWPGQKGKGFQPPLGLIPNPLRVGPNEGHLKALQRRLEKPLS
jgi:hypothetical protein